GASSLGSEAHFFDPRHDPSERGDRGRRPVAAGEDHSGDPRALSEHGLNEEGAHRMPHHEDGLVAISASNLFEQRQKIVASCDKAAFITEMAELLGRARRLSMPAMVGDEAL